MGFPRPVFFIEYRCSLIGNLSRLIDKCVAFFNLSMNNSCMLNNVREHAAMPWFDFIWSPETIEHIAQHGVTVEEFEDVVQNPEGVDFSKSSGNLLAKGTSRNGKYIVAIYLMIDDITVLPITAYEPE